MNLFCLPFTFSQFGYFVLCPRSGRHRLIRCTVYFFYAVCQESFWLRQHRDMCNPFVNQSTNHSINQSENLWIPYCQKLINFIWKTSESNRIWIKYLIVYKNVLIFYCPFVTFWSFCNILKTLICFYRYLRDTMH